MNPIKQAIEKSAETVTKTLQFIDDNPHQFWGKASNFEDRVRLIKKEVCATDKWIKQGESGEAVINNFICTSREQKLLRMHYGNINYNIAHSIIENEGITEAACSHLIQGADFYQRI